MSSINQAEMIAEGGERVVDDNGAAIESNLSENEEEIEGEITQPIPLSFLERTPFELVLMIVKRYYDALYAENGHPIRPMKQLSSIPIFRDHAQRLLTQDVMIKNKKSAQTFVKYRNPHHPVRTLSFIGPLYQTTVMSVLNKIESPTITSLQTRSHTGSRLQVSYLTHPSLENLHYLDLEKHSIRNSSLAFIPGAPLPFHRLKSLKVDPKGNYFLSYLYPHIFLACSNGTLRRLDLVLDRQIEFPRTSEHYDRVSTTLENLAIIAKGSWSEQYSTTFLRTEIGRFIAPCSSLKVLNLNLNCNWQETFFFNDYLPILSKLPTSTVTTLSLRITGNVMSPDEINRGIQSIVSLESLAKMKKLTIYGFPHLWEEHVWEVEEYWMEKGLDFEIIVTGIDFD